MSVGLSSALVSPNQQVQIQQQQVIPLPLARLMAIAETSVVGVFDQIALLLARLEAAERQNREMAAMYGAQLSANAQAIATLSDQVRVLGTLQSELAITREENAELKQANAKLLERLRGIVHNYTVVHTTIDADNGNMNIQRFEAIQSNVQQLYRLITETSTNH